MLRLKLARQTYCNYENGKREPDTKTMRLMAKYFGVSLDYLFGEDNPPENQKIPKDLKKILGEKIRYRFYAAFRHFC